VTVVRAGLQPDRRLRGGWRRRRSFPGGNATGGDEKAEQRREGDKTKALDFQMAHDDLHNFDQS
jgi:hypothetical protein